MVDSRKWVQQSLRFEDAKRRVAADGSGILRRVQILAVGLLQGLGFCDDNIIIRNQKKNLLQLLSTAPSSWAYKTFSTMAARLARFCGLTSLLLVSTHAFSRPPSLLSSVRAASRSRSSQRPSGARSLTKPSNQPLRRGPAPLRLGAVEEALAGAFFPLSLPPYLAFLYWAGYAPNQMPKMALFGFQVLGRNHSRVV